jgi:hypothetical protein
MFSIFKSKETSTNQTTTNARAPRGIRNCNPGNIEFNDDNTWQGMSGHDGRFAIFTAPKWGIRAMAVTLINYQRKHKLNSIKELINRWAPSTENSTHTYIDAVSSRVGVDAETAIDLTNPQIMRPLLQAMIHVECGQQPYADHEFDEAMQLAGMDVKRHLEVKPLAKSRTMRGVAIGIAGTALAFVFENQDMIISIATVISPGTAFFLSKALTIGGLIYAGYARLDDNRKAVK